MDVITFARRYLGQFKQHGSEILPVYCPFCGGGKNKDKYSFAINIDKETFNCKRGSCARQGHFNQLLKEFGEEVNRTANYEMRRPTPKKYKKPVTEIETPKEKVENYLKLRGFSKEVWERRGVGESNGNIVFPYYENGQLVMLKFRKPEKYNGKGMKSWREEGGKAVLWGMDLCDPSNPLVITEGECFHGSTEILTEKGWERLDSYKNGKVLQVHDNLTATFIKPLALIKKHFTGDLLRIDRGGNYLSLTTPDHNMVYRQDGNLFKRKACEMPKTLRGDIPTTVIIDGIGIKLTYNQIALCLAISADGTVDHRKGGGKIKAKEPRYARFAFNKKRKIERLKKILDCLEIEYSEGTDKREFTNICFSMPQWCTERMLPMEWITLATKEQREFIINEMVYWDGNFVGGRNQTEYSSKYYENASFMQTIAHSIGKMSTIMKRKNRFGEWYKVSILHNKNSISWQSIETKKIPHDDLVYCVNVPTGMILVRQEGKISVSGNCDAIALDEAGIENVVSVPSGSQDLTWIENCWEWLEQFKQIIIWGDNDEPGKKMVREVITRLGDWRCYVVDSEHKDANVSLAIDGPLKTAERVFNAKPVPINGLIDLADVVTPDYDNIERVISGLSSIDKSMGGFLMGELTVWTGKSGQGKSTLLGQMMLEAIDEGFNVCAYSGELRADRFQYWVNLQAAGNKYISYRYDDVRQKKIPFIPKLINEKIKNWYRGRFWLYDNNINNDNSENTGIIKLFTYAARKYNCKLFLVDNLMTSKFNTGKSDSDFYRAQSEFVGELMHFAKTYNAHVHLVAHPKKTKDKLGKEDVSGTGDITNRADNVLSVERDAEHPLSNIVTILKNRSDGVQDRSIGLLFDPSSKRFWQESDKAGEGKKYGWEDLPDVVPKCVSFEEYCKEDF